MDPSLQNRAAPKKTLHPKNRTKTKHLPQKNTRPTANEKEKRARGPTDHPTDGRTAEPKSAQKRKSNDFNEEPSKSLMLQ